MIILLKRKQETLFHTTVSGHADLHRNYKKLKNQSNIYKKMKILKCMILSRSFIILGLSQQFTEAATTGVL